MISSSLEKLNLWFEKLPQALAPYSLWIIMIFFVSSAIMMYGTATRFQMEMSIETMFPKNDPARATLDDFRHRFGSDDGVYVVYEASDGDVFSEESVNLIRKLHMELDDARVARGEGATSLNRIEKVDSLYNIRLQVVEGDTLISQNLLATDFPKTAEERELKREIALTQDTFRLAYFSDDFKYGGIRIKTDFGTIVKGSQQDDGQFEEDLLSDEFADDFSLGDDSEAGLIFDESIETQKIEYETTQMEEYLELMADLRAITEKPDYQHFDFHYSGNAPMMEFSAQTVLEGSFLISGMVVVFIFLLWALFHSGSAVVWPITVIMGSTAWAIGVFTWLDVVLSQMVMLTAMLIMAVGVAACVHVLSTYGLYRKEGQEHIEALSTTYRQTGVPIFLTSFTTMVGMGSLLVSDLPQIGTFGGLSAIGVFVSFIMVMFVLPAFLHYWRPYTKVETVQQQGDAPHGEEAMSVNWLRPFLERLPGFAQRNAKTIVFIYLGLFLLFIYGATKLKVDTNPSEQARGESAVRIASQIVDSNMMGGQTMEIMLDLHEANAFKDPDVLKALEAFQKHIVATYPKYIVKTFSIADYVKETNKAMHEDREEFKVIPDDPRLAAQLLYMFNNSNSEDRRNLVSDDYSYSHITIQMKSAGSYEYTTTFEALAVDVETYFGPLKNKYPEMEVHDTGTLPLMMKLLDKMSWAQIKSFSLAIAIISIFLIVALNSLKGGLISMLPNILPSISTFGIMGLIGMSLDTTTLVVAPLIIGIAVDDTIHFMAHYRDAWFRTGDMNESMVETIYEVGQAVTFTTIILATGFAVLGFSDFLGVAKTGIFGALAILVALSCDLFLLPASIALMKPDLGRKKHFENLNQQQA